MDRRYLDLQKAQEREVIRHAWSLANHTGVT
jgi:hypothetical protein